jgi:hypothetical protein
MGISGIGCAAYPAKTQLARPIQGYELAPIWKKLVAILWKALTYAYSSPIY